MPVIERYISLEVPVETVFQHLGNPAHYAGLCPDSLEISDLRPHPPVHVKFTWAYKMLGIHLYGEAELHETRHDQELHLHFWGGMHGSLVWQVQAVNEGTIVHFTLDYTVPTPLLKKHAEASILQHNAAEIDQVLANLKARLESETLSANAET